MVDDTTLLGIDATIITGALILLTVTSFIGKKDHETYSTKLFGNNFIPWTPQQVGSGTIVLFGVAALLILGSSHMKGLHTASVLVDGLGFIWLVISGYVISTKEQFINKSKKPGDEKLED